MYYNIMLCVYRSQTTAHVKRTLVSMSETGVKMSFSDGDAVNLPYPAATHVNNGNWHYVALGLDNNQVTVYLDGSTGHGNFTPVDSV